MIFEIAIVNAYIKLMVNNYDNHLDFIYNIYIQIVCRVLSAGELPPKHFADCHSTN